MNRRGFLQLLGMASPAIVLARDYRFPVAEIAPMPVVRPAEMLPSVDLSMLTQRMATMLAERLPEGLVVADLDREQARPGVSVLAREWLCNIRNLERATVPVSRIHRIDLVQWNVALDPLTGPRDADAWLEPAVEALADQMRHDGVRVTAALPIPGGGESALAVRGGVAVRGMAGFNINAWGAVRFDVLYG